MRFYEAEAASLFGFKPSTKVVALMLASRMNNTNPEWPGRPVCWPGFKTLEADTGMSRRTINYAIAELVEAKVIRVYRESSAQGGWLHNVYEWTAHLSPSYNPDWMKKASSDDPAPGARLKPEGWDICEREGIGPARLARERPDLLEPLPEGAQEPQEDVIDAEVVEEPAPAAEAPQKPSQELVKEEPYREDVEALCQHMLASINHPGTKRREITKGWRTAARLLLDRDHRPLDEAMRLITWATQDSFWQSNILSLPKFREKYDTLLLQARRPRNQGANGDSQAAIARRLTEKSIRTAVQNGDMSPEKARRLAEAELYGTQNDVWAILEEPDEDDWVTQALAELPPNYKEIYS